MHKELKVSGLNHIAIKTKSVEVMSNFYANILGLQELKRHHDELGLRSIWLQIQSRILMIERSDHLVDESKPSEDNFITDPPGIHLIAFNIKESSKESWRKHLNMHEIKIEHESKYTIYFFDPDENRIGLSAFDPASITN